MSARTLDCILREVVLRIGALGAVAACDAGPANVLTVDEQGREDAGRACEAGSSCASGAESGSPDTSCTCIPGVKVACLETREFSDDLCENFLGTRRCEPDGSWTPCMPPATLDALSGAVCTVVQVRCGALADMPSYEGNCQDILPCPPASPEADPL